jgi:hypothetical protein
VLPFGTYQTVFPIPETAGRLLTQASLGLALVLALAVNPRGIVRPHLFLVLIMSLGVVALMASVHNEFVLGSLFRACRLLGFLLVLWLLTPWWGRRDLVLLRAHRFCLWVVLIVVLAGAAVAPGLAFGFEGRLMGVLWPVSPTQVAHYAAVLFGSSVVMWMCRVLSGRATLLALAVSGAVLVSTHTRTAMLAMVLALLVACASLFLGHARVRRTSALGALGVIVVATIFASELTTWVLRGQSMQDAQQLTGRTQVWTKVLSTPRPRIKEMFGSGLSDQSFDGLPIDSNWVATFLDLGWFGVIVQVALLLLLLLMAATRERGPQRGVAFFLIIYCLAASFTETGLTTPSTYLLDLTIAASLLVPEVKRSRA